jgi:hypothetical protein
MTRHAQTRRWLTAGLIATTALALASPAFAGSSRRFKGVSHSSPVQRVVVREHSSGAGPVLAGLIGGVILGAALSSNAYPVVVHERVHRRPVVVYRYYDPYDDVWFDSLDDCDFRGHRRHPRVIHVIEVRSGRHIQTLRHRDGRWHRFDRRGDDRGWDDDGRRWKDDGWRGDDVHYSDDRGRD